MFREPLILAPGDDIISESLHYNYTKSKVVRVTKTQAILDNGKRIPIDGGNGCQEIPHWSNKSYRHITTYYKFPNHTVLKRASDRNHPIIKEFYH